MEYTPMPNCAHLSLYLMYLRLGVVATETLYVNFSDIKIYPKFNLDFQITLIFARLLCSLAARAPVKHEYDIVQVNSVLVVLKKGN